MKNYTTLSEMLKNEGITQRQLSKIIDVHPSAISNTVKGRMAIPSKWVKIIRDQLNINIGDPPNISNPGHIDIYNEIRLILDRLAKIENDLITIKSKILI